MKKFFYNIDYKKLSLVFVIGLMVLSLSGCVTGQDKPLNGFTDENDIFNWLLVWPIGWLMSTIGNFLGGSFGWALIITTIIVRFISWPIYMSTTNTTYKMQLAQPDLQRVQAKYAGRTDDNSKQRMQQETMAIYKKHKVNPLGCIGIVFQFPIFSAMFTVIKRITVADGDLTLSNFKFLGFDLAKFTTDDDGNLIRVATSVFEGGIGNQIFCAVLTAGVVGTIILQQHLSRKKASYQKNIPNKTPTSMEQNMKMMMWISPIMMGYIASQDAGMALYWVVGNLFALFQLIYVRRRNEKKYYKDNSLEINPRDFK